MMLLVDTSVWIDHFRRAVPALADVLSRQVVLTHPVVIGELATGNLKDRKRTLSDLRMIPQAEVVSADECLYFLEAHELYGRGIGWNDVQLLASARLASARLWSTDKRLRQEAEKLDLAYARE